MGKRNLVYIEALRTFALLGVIFFHVAGMLKGKLTNANIPEFPAIMQTSSYWVGIAVSLFMFIAGYLYRRPVGKLQIMQFVKKKSMHLLLPYVVFAILIMLTSGFFDFGELLSGDFWHLWFFTALFWCFIFSLCIDYSSKWGIVILVASLICSIVEIPRILGLSNFVQWFYFFALGAVVKSHPTVMTAIKRNHLWLLLLLMYVAVKIAIPFHYRQPSIVHTMSDSAAILVIWLIFINLNKIKSGVFLAIGENSMGIYIMHYWLLIYILSGTSFRIFDISQFMESCPWVTVIVIVIVTFVISIAIVAISRMTRMGRLLLG